MGRPSKYDPKFNKQAGKLCALGATDREIEEFFALMPTEDDWLFACLLVIRQDRRGVSAAQKAKRSISRRAYLAANPSQRIRNSVSARLWAALKGRPDGALFSRLGYTAADLVAHLETQFAGGMSWDNYGLWHVDHIKPCAVFDLTIQEQFDECWALSNLQPLWAIENSKKGASYVSP